MNGLKFHKTSNLSPKSAYSYIEKPIKLKKSVPIYYEKEYIRGKSSSRKFLNENWKIKDSIYPTKNSISLKSLREINSYYRNAISKNNGNILVNGFHDQHYIFLGHETLIILNSLTYSCDGEFNIETLQGNQKQRYSFCLPFLKPTFRQFLTYFVENFKHVKSSNPQLQYIVEAFSQTRKFLRSLCLETDIKDEYSISDYSVLDSITLSIYSCFIQNFKPFRILLELPLEECIEREISTLKNIEILLAENTHVNFDFHLDYKDKSSTTYSSNSSSYSQVSTSSNDSYNDIVSQNYNIFLNNLENLTIPQNENFDYDISFQKNEPENNSLLNENPITDYQKFTEKENLRATSNSKNKCSKDFLKPKSFVNTNLFHRTTVLYLKSTQKWCILVPINNDQYFIKQYPSLSLGFFVAKIKAFKFAFKSVNKKSYIQYENTSFFLQRKQLKVLKKENDFTSTKEYEFFNSIDSFFPYERFITKNFQNILTFLKLKELAFFYTISSIDCISNVNLSISRFLHKNDQKYVLKSYLMHRKQEKIQYMKKISNKIDLQTKKIISAKREREETYYDCRRKPPMDKFDPELIASQVLNKNGVLLRQVQDLNFYQRQVMYKECIQRGLQAPIYIALNVLKEKGRSVFAAYRIEQGEFVLEYKGDLINRNEYEIRERQYLRDLGKFYCYSTFIFSFKINGKMWYIDATSENPNWGAGRLVNHSHLQPNLCVCSVIMNGHPRLFFYARKEIQAKEELLVDYGEQDPSILNSPHFSWLKKN